MPDKLVTASEPVDGVDALPTKAAKAKSKLAAKKPRSKALKVTKFTEDSDEEWETTTNPVQKAKVKATRAVRKPTAKVKPKSGASARKPAVKKKSTNKVPDDASDHGLSEDEAVQHQAENGANIDKNSRPLIDIKDIFHHMADQGSNLTDGHSLKDVVKSLRNRPINVATMCSGTESPIIALTLIRNGKSFNHTIALKLINSSTSRIKSRPRVEL